MFGRCGTRFRCGDGSLRGRIGELRRRGVAPVLSRLLHSGRVEGVRQRSRVDPSIVATDPMSSITEHAKRAATDSRSPPRRPRHRWAHRPPIAEPTPATCYVRTPRRACRSVAPTPVTRRRGGRSGQTVRSVYNSSISRRVGIARFGARVGLSVACRGPIEAAGKGPCGDGSSRGAGADTGDPTVLGRRPCR